MSVIHLKATRAGLFVRAEIWSCDSQQQRLDVSMECVTEAADPAARTYSQVLFMDIPHSYPPSAPITCRFTLNAAFRPHSRDWVGIFKVGWSSTKEYHTFVWVEPCQDAEGQQVMTRQAVFKDYYLPKDEIEFYQFCYIDSTGQVRGASTPFCFRNPAEQSLESNTDDDLLVITTQEQVEQSLREKAELQKELQQLRAENESLKSALQKEQEETTTFKEQDDQRESENTNLVREMDQIREDNEQLRNTLQLQQQENERLKEEMEIQKTKQVEIELHNTTEQEKQSQALKSLRTNEEKYDRAVMKINQLKEQRDEQRDKIDAQSEEIDKLKAKLREGERELLKAKDSMQLLQIDLQSSEKEKERLAAELQRLRGLADSMDEVKQENRELCRRLSQQETVQNLPKDDLKVQNQSLGRQLQDVQEKLSAEKEESRKAKRGAGILEQELQQARDQLQSVVLSYEQEKRKSSKYEMQLEEMNELIADKNIFIQEKEQQIMLMEQEKDQLDRENRGLRDDIEGLRRVCANLNTAPADSDYVQPDIPSPTGDTPATHDPQETPQDSGSLYESIDVCGALHEEQSLVCRHCQESFPGITPNELEQHEQSHRVCPFCTMICDDMEQSAFEDHVYGHEL